MTDEIIARVDEALNEELTDQADAPEAQIQEIAAFFDGLSGPLAKYDETYVRRLFPRITAYDDKVVSAFKAGKEVMIKE